MGRRSINTTKSGKYMNPTDQARKEARKKELKKNKRQRQIVRTAVLRGKDPMQLLQEMEKIDQMEYNVMQPSPLNEKVLRDKRKKLRDTFDRVMKMYYKDDPHKWEEIRIAEGEYEKRRQNMLAYYEAVRFTQQVSVDEIPLPMSQMGVDSMMGMGAIPMPNEYGMLPLPPYSAALPPPPGILRKKSMYSPPPSPSRVSKRNKIPPGVPPGPPPELSGEEDDDFDDDRGKNDNRSSESEYDSDKESRKKKRKGKAIRFAESESSDSENEDLKKKSKVYSSGHDIDQFMKEMEEVHKRSRNDKESEKESEGTMKVSAPSGQMPSGLPPAPPLGVPPHMMYRPPPMMMGGIRLPPGPPPGRPPTLPPGPPPGLPPRLQSSGIRLPPGPPPGVPPSMMRFSTSNSNSVAPGNPNVVSAAPQLINREGDIQPPGEEQPKSSATIEAKAKIRNLNADITRFLPISVRIKRDDGKSKPKPEKRLSMPMDIPKPFQKPIPNPAPNATQPTKDDAYMQFMKEMEGLL